MAKYRLLNQDELKELEPEFIQFLVVNSITADDWVKLKEEEIDKANKLVELFSDVVWQNIIDKVKFLELYTEKYIQTIQCNSDKLIMVALTHTDKDFIFNQNFNLDAIGQEGFLLHTSEKKYENGRDLELFKLLNKGFVATEGKLFKELILASVK